MRSGPYAATISPLEHNLKTVVAVALAEDTGGRDITTELVLAQGARARGRIVQKQPGVLFGLDAVEEVLSQCGIADLERLAIEGEWRDEGPTPVASVSGPAASLLAAERTALNFLCHLSGVATLTAEFVRAVQGSSAVIIDTRKTTPGLRFLEKAAVVAGGGVNHRMGLYDAVLIKDNHIALAGSVAQAVRLALEAKPAGGVEVECGTLEEVEAALDAGADRILLDNMGTEALAAAVSLRDAGERAHGPVAALEASGGISLENVAAIAATGVDFISVGALTHSAPALDLSMELEPSE